MSWLKQANRLVGYKIVGYDGQRAYSLYDPRQTVNLSVGSVTGPTYLGTTPQFCMDYYTGLAKEGHRDILLTYSYAEEDITSGDPSGSGEVQVSRATLQAVKFL